MRIVIITKNALRIIDFYINYIFKHPFSMSVYQIPRPPDLRRQEAVILRAGEGSGVGILRLGKAGNHVAADKGAVGRSDWEPASRLSPVFVIFVVHHDARQRGAAEGPYLLHDVAKAVVVGALDEFHRTVGRQERPGDDAAAGWGLRTNGTNG